MKPGVNVQASPPLRSHGEERGQGASRCRRIKTRR